jgi:fibrillarin-like pre-rRNA processing protein
MIVRIKGRFYTRNLVPGQSVYGENLKRIKGKEYREWDPRRSKLGAGLQKGVKNYFKKDNKALYLGAATGTTVSHVSDLVPNGRVYAVEFAPESMKHLIILAKKRENIIPLFNDANKPDEYEFIEKVDIVFQDVAQRNQVEIFTKNCKAFLKKQGIGLLVIKSRSINVSKKPGLVFKQVENELKKNFKILYSTRLEPFEKDHKMYVLVMK